MALTRALLVALTAALAPATAQESPHWTAAEAALPALLRELAQSPWAGRASGLMELVARGANPLPMLAGMRPETGAGPDAGGAARLGGYLLRLDNARTGAQGTGFALYAWPAEDTAGTRAFVVGSAGEVLTTDGMSRPYRGDTAPAWNAAVAARSADQLEQLLAARGTGRDGHLWLPVPRGRTTRVAIRVRGLDPGLERETQVLVGPAAWFGATPATALGEVALPAGIVTLERDGTATLTGVHTPGLCVALRVQRSLVASLRLTRTGDEVELGFDVEQLCAQRVAANEAAAIATLRNISSAQAQCQASGVIDGDQDGTGEYGYFGELSGKVALRGNAAGNKLSPPVLSAAFGNVQGGRVVRSGYVYQLHLPGTAGTWLAEADQGGAGATAPAPDAAERGFRCYAWPVRYGRSGRRAFVVDERGDVRAWDAEGRFSGDDQPVPATAAYGADATRWTATR